MKVTKLWVVVFAVAMFAACNSRREAPTSSSYGMEMLSGQVAITGLDNGSPAGVEVSVRGTGMKQTLTESGEFLFAGVPEGAQLDFHRAADGIEASMKVDSRSGFLAVELTKTTATASKKSSRRRGVGATREVVYEFEGLILAAAPDSITLFTSKKVEQEIGLTPETIIRKGQTPVAPEDLAVDMRVHVKAKKGDDDTYTAVVVIVQNDGGDDDDGEPPAVKEYEGLVREAGAAELVVFTSHGVEETFVLTEDTVIRKGNTAIAPEDILVGWRVHVKATTGEDGTKTATLVIVQNNPPEEVSLEGTVASVGTSGFVVTTADGEVTVEVSPSTQIRKNGKKIALSDIETGDAVEVEGTRVDATTVQARKVTVED
jgi:hypothetical protein